MSGSPIIQDGKLVGAVTHVLVNDPTRWYGIFIENMPDAKDKKQTRKGDTIPLSFLPLCDTKTFLYSILFALYRISHIRYFWKAIGYFFVSCLFVSDLGCYLFQKERRYQK